ncbi:MAG: histidine phosphatase family protein, partial [Gammaproteobacteria bacterium]|nr:histidine phosphatase family protein [Gammaproteobacteria bacterium]
MTTYIDVIRHGEPVGGRRYRGYSVDDPLTDKGWEQMRAAIPETPRWQHIVSSPLKRCLDFSQELASDLHIPFSIDDNVKEIGFGDWEGKTPE